ncbi:MAG: GTPase domain-containing protein [Candidatus Hodarchaeota archaeon]
MVNIGILGFENCGKTSLFLQFIKRVEDSGSRVFDGARGGDERYRTVSVDFIRFSWKGFTHTLYGTGGHRERVTDYYRIFVIRNADRFLCMIDLEAPLKAQLEFFRSFEIPTKNVALSFNKYDLKPNNLDKYSPKIIDLFENELKKRIKEKYVTVAITKEGYEEYIANCAQSVLSLCEWDQKGDPFDIWLATSD